MVPEYMAASMVVKEPKLALQNIIAAIKTRIIRGPRSGPKKNRSTASAMLDGTEQISASSTFAEKIVKDRELGDFPRELR
mmetsp:Transcript_6010/g.8503  ORF Transcript_6010/g.8503 Transcript_6010/m.8503 type:complete len:80 (-) Transcript_6010:311-550(-)